AVVAGSWHRARRLCTSVLAVALWSSARVAVAAQEPVGDAVSLEGAYRDAMAALDEIDLPGALRLLDDALAASTHADDPRRATLLAFKAGVLFAIDGDEAATLAVLREAV